MDNDTNLLVDILDECGIISTGDGLIRSLNCGEVSEDYGSITIPETGYEGKLKKIEEILLKYVGKEQESIFWIALLNKEIPPTFIELLCLYLVSKDPLFQYGVEIYSILLCSEQCNKVWSPILFAPILKTLITAQQLIENGGKLNEQTKSQLNLAVYVMSKLSHVSESFANLIGSEILAALCELIMKLVFGNRVEFDSFNTIFSKECLNTAKIIAKTNLDNLLPYIVPALLLNYVSCSSFTTRIEKLRDKILSFVLSLFEPNDDRIVLLCKHLMMRSPEKVFLRKSAAHIVYSLTKYSVDAQLIINFALKLGKSTKIRLRAFALYLLQIYIVNINELVSVLGSESSEVALEIADIVKARLSDPAPTVRAIALDCLASIIENLNDNQYGVVIKHVIDSSGSLETVLRHRIVEEKFSVRKSALLCLTQIVISNARSITPIMISLISGRIRDRVVSIRTLAIKSLNSAIERFPNNELLNKTWLDSVLPSILDDETSVQFEAYNSVSKYIFNPLIEGDICYFPLIMTNQHFDFMRNIFVFCKQKSIPLSKISNAFSKILLNNLKNNDEDVNYIKSIWKLVSILSSVVPSHFKSSLYYDLWNEYTNLPPEYFLILANLNFKNDEIKEDLTAFLNSEITENSKKYELIHSILQLIRIQDDVEPKFVELLASWCESINNTVQSQNVSQNELENLATVIYAAGEVISLLSKSHFLNDLNYTGLQILFSLNLPNGEPVPPQICALSVITLGKLCLVQKDLSRSFVAAFAHLLSSKSSSPTVKCNCLIVLCDLCVAYSALVEPYVKMITHCFADPSPLVRHQTLILLTRLIVEDYLKMSSIMFFRYTYAMTDKNSGVSSFAANCLLNVITNKIHDLIGSHFMEALFYFSNEASVRTFDETDEERKLFGLKNTKNRHFALSMLISKMDNMVAFKTTEAICKNVFAKFINSEFNLSNHSTILEDSIYSLIELEEKMDQSLDLDFAEDEAGEKVLEVGKQIIQRVAEMRNSIIQGVMPTLNKMHRLLRDKHSPLQTQLKVFYQRICSKNPELIKKLETDEPLLAIEIKYEMEEAEETVKEEEDKSEDEEKDEMQRTVHINPMQTPSRAIFESSLLSRIASTPRSMLCTPYKSSEKHRLEEEVEENEIRQSENHHENDFVLETPKKKSVVFKLKTPPHDPNLLD